MNDLFTYNLLQVYLLPTTKTLAIDIKDTDQNKTLTHELLFELESILSWAFDKIEICSIILGNEKTTSFQKTHQYLNQDKEYLAKLHSRLFDLNRLILKVPQTVIVDLGEGASGQDIDLFLAADIRIAHKSGGLFFNYLSQGILPYHSHQLLSNAVGMARASQWILAGKKVSHQEAEQAGLIFVLYDETNVIDQKNALLTAIFEQMPVTRIQAKLALNRNLLLILEAGQSEDFKILQGTLVAEEWKMAPLKQKTRSTQLTAANGQTTLAKNQANSLSTKTHHHENKQAQILPFRRLKNKDKDIDSSP